nr:uncharacterized protein CI109_006281 [Kwoniella shandongensis]KAA5525382.1 hypothetical protein CI109_006281 [Kwoniella shandongensis]
MNSNQFDSEAFGMALSKAIKEESLTSEIENSTSSQASGHLSSQPPVYQHLADGGPSYIALPPAEYHNRVETYSGPNARGGTASAYAALWGL